MNASERVARRLGRTIMALVWLAAVGGPAVAQNAEKADARGSGSDPPTTQPTVSPESPRTIIIYLGGSKVIDSPWPVARVSIGSPDIADVQMLTPTQVLVIGKAPGSTDLILGSKDDKIWQSRVGIKADVRQLEAELAKLFPRSRLSVVQPESGRPIVISGTLSRAEQVAQLQEFMKSTGIKFVDMTSLGGVQQVQIRVRVAEVSRTAIRALGINALQTGNDVFSGMTIGSDSGGPINPTISMGPPEGTSAAISKIPFVFANDVGSLGTITLFGGFPRAGLEFFIQAMEENQYLRVLAQPTLVALSGQEAEFLAGGEFPVPVPQSVSAGSQTITIEYRPFGVHLKFRPVVLGDGRIQLRVAPEVSELAEAGSLFGFPVYSVQARRAETMLEMNSGETFAMAGLLSRSDTARSSRVPGLGDIPVLGALWRSTRYVKRETELVVLVEASLVEPMSIPGPLPVPGLRYRAPDAWEFYAEGRVESKKPARLSAAEAGRLKEMGWDRLRGPGAWVSCDDDVPSGQGTSTPASPTTAPTSPVSP